MLRMPVVWDERCRLHDPGGEIWVGMRTPGTESPARAEAILAAFDGPAVVAAEQHPDDVLLAVHDPALVAYLRTAWDEWVRAGLPDDPGQDRVVPYVFLHPGLGVPVPRVPTAAWARPGFFTYDTMTLVGPGTWEAARGAVDAALTAADLVATGTARHAYACCRPPGHHACRTCFGGSCYLNNAAVAAEALRRGGSRVAVLDIDAHHGNGTQEIFWETDDVRVASVHVDPGDGWFPHYLGFADETAGGANLNIPVPPGSGDGDWLAAVCEAADWAGRADALVVPLGVDAAAGDPESPLRVTAGGFREAGRIIGALGLPTVLIQEGGYDLETLGPLVREVLLGVEDV